ncbi:hypothetical protein D3C71_1575630 [compost metagenome]
MTTPNPGICTAAGGMRNNSMKNSARGLCSRRPARYMMIAAAPAYTQKLCDTKASSVRMNHRLRRRLKSR